MERIVSLDKYRRWLEVKLAQLDMSSSYLVALVIVLERVLAEETRMLTGRRVNYFYTLYTKENKQSKAWFYAAELAVWLSYKGFDPHDYFSTVVKHPTIRGWLRRSKQAPLNVIMPSARKPESKERLKEYEEFYLKRSRRRHRGAQ